jgi:Lrp/AsnC family leucine-responsive transcriptional regulator
MGGTVDIDDIDIKILEMLIKDARTRQKDIAKECGISSVSVLNRIKRLKKLKVITGATLYPSLSVFGLPFAATIGVCFEESEDKEILKLISQLTHLIEPSLSVGEYDFCAFVFAESLHELDVTVHSIRNQFQASKVVINVWSGQPIFSHENIDLKPKREW